MVIIYLMIVTMVNEIHKCNKGQGRGVKYTLLKGTTSEVNQQQEIFSTFLNQRFSLQKDLQVLNCEKLNVFYKMQKNSYIDSRRN